MEKITLFNLDIDRLRRLVDLQEGAVSSHRWTNVEAIELDDRDLRQLQEITSRLLNYQTHLMNEATIWARGIYPLLVLAEKQSIQAWAGVTLKASYTKFEIDGVADGALGKCVAGLVESPFLVVVEAKKGIEGQNPLYQLYGQLLAAAHLNWEKDERSKQEIFGCYTIADSWTFLRAEVEKIDTDKPILRVEYSREYVEKLEADKILKILKGIVTQYLERSG